MNERTSRPLRSKVMLPLLALGILAAAGIGVLSYLSIEAQLMRQLRYRAVQMIDTVSVGSESLDQVRELQHVVLAVSVSPDTSLIVVVDSNQRIIAASSSNLIDRQADRERCHESGAHGNSLRGDDDRFRHRQRVDRDATGEAGIGCHAP